MGLLLHPSSALALLVSALWPAVASAEPAAASGGGGAKLGPILAACTGVLFGAWLAMRRIRSERDD